MPSPPVRLNLRFLSCFVRRRATNRPRTALCPLSAPCSSLGARALPAHSRSLLNTDDLAQEVLCRAVVSLEMFDPRHEGAFQGFLRQIMLNRVRDEVRSARRKPTDELIEDEHLRRIPLLWSWRLGKRHLNDTKLALQRLKPQDRELIVARCELDFSNDEIAALFDKPTPSAARVAVGRASRNWQRRWPVADDFSLTTWHQQSLNGHRLTGTTQKNVPETTPSARRVQALHVLAKMAEVVRDAATPATCR